MQGPSLHHDCLCALALPAPVSQRKAAPTQADSGLRRNVCVLTVDWLRRLVVLRLSRQRRKAPPCFRWPVYRVTPAGDNGRRSRLPGGGLSGAGGRRISLQRSRYRRRRRPGVTPPDASFSLPRATAASASAVLARARRNSRVRVSGDT